MRGLAPDDRAVPGSELEPHCSADEALRALNVRGQVLVQCAIPLSVVDEPRVLARDDLFEARLLATEGEALQGLVRGVQHNRCRCLVNLARLDAHQAILDVVNAPDPAGTGQGVELFDKRHALDLSPVQRHRNAALKRDLDIGWLAGWGAGSPGVDLGGWLGPGVFQDAAF